MKHLKQWLLIVAGGIVLGLITHLASLLALPALVPNPPYVRLAADGSPNRFVQLTSRAADPAIPFLDPTFRLAVCRFDLHERPLYIHAPVAGLYTALSFYTPEGLPFFAINDRSAVGGALEVALRGPQMPPPSATDQDGAAVVVESPRRIGLVVLRVMAPPASAATAADAEFSGASCDGPPPQPQSAPPAAEDSPSLQILRMAPSGGGGAKVVPVPVAPPTQR